MSRKTKLDLWIDKLEQISDCPRDIFKKIEADEKLFHAVESAESGDLSSIK